MKVIFDHQIFNLQKYGGASRYFFELLKHSNSLFDYELTGLYSDNIYTKALKIHKEFPVKTKFYGKQKIISLINRTNAIKKLNTGNYDVIHSTLYEPYILKNNKKPVVITVHDMIHELFPEYFGIKNVYSNKKKYMILKANKINVNSYTTKNDVLRFFPQVEEKITVTYLAYSTNIIDSIIEKENYILFIGQRGLYKNFDNFVKAVAPLLYKYNLKLLCTGSPFNETEIAMFEELNIQDRVTCQFVAEEEIGTLYAKAIAFVFPSLYEGFGIPLLEAFSSRCPVIASNSGSLPEVGGDAAVYFDPYSVDDMRSVINNVLTSPALQKELVVKGMDQVKKYSWEKCASETADVYKRLLGKNK